MTYENFPFKLNSFAIVPTTDRDGAVCADPEPDADEAVADVEAEAAAEFEAVADNGAVPVTV